MKLLILENCTMHILLWKILLSLLETRLWKGYKAAWNNMLHKQSKKSPFFMLLGKLPHCKDTALYWKFETNNPRKEIARERGRTVTFQEYINRISFAVKTDNPKVFETTWSHQRTVILKKHISRKTFLQQPGFRSVGHTSKLRRRL